MSTLPTMSTRQISDLHAALVEELGHGIDPARVRAAVERAGFVWDTSCPHSTLRKITYPDRFEYICATDGHTQCHEKFRVVDSVSDTPIEDLDLTVRAYNVLKREGVHTVGQLRTYDIEDLLDMRNMGRGGIESVVSRLREHGLTLKPHEVFGVDLQGREI